MSRATNAILDKTQNAVPATQPAEGLPGAVAAGRRHA